MSSFRPEKIGLYASGGDAPGMNAAIRAVVRSASAHQIPVVGIISGYSGMLSKKFVDLSSRSMGNIIQRGGSILKAGRCPEFHKKEHRKKAVENLRMVGIDSLICIGGDGSFTGALALWNEHKFPCIGIPGTIDNDIYGTDTTVGFDTAVNTALDAIDKIRDTASSHDRLFIVEVMGRNSGYIALNVGVAGGAEEIFAPEYPITTDHVVRKIKESHEKGKLSSILVMAEGQKPGRAYDLAEALRKKCGLDAKVCILGHIQRGGSPTANDRILASYLGHASVEALLNFKQSCMVGMVNGKVIQTSFDDAIHKEKKPSRDLLDLCEILAMS